MGFPSLVPAVEYLVSVSTEDSDDVNHRDLNLLIFNGGILFLDFIILNYFPPLWIYILSHFFVAVPPNSLMFSSTVSNIITVLPSMFFTSKGTLSFKTIVYVSI